MSDAKKRKFNERMDAIHKKYCDQLPEKYQAIEDSWIAYQTDLTNDSALEVFYRLIHTLKGTAATFGFVQQADICFDIQKILIAVKDEGLNLTNDLVDQIQDHIQDLKNNINSPAQDIKN